MTQAAPPPLPQWDRESLLLGADEMLRALRRIGHEMVERNGQDGDMVLAGIPTRGVPLAERLGAILGDLGAPRTEILELLIEGHRDDREGGRAATAPGSSPPQSTIDVTGRVVVLVDDVIFHGRTARAALDALTELGRPAAVQLAVLVDRGHRELPIRADYVGKNIPTHLNDRVRVLLQEVDGVDAVYLVRDFA